MGILRRFALGITAAAVVVSLETLVVRGQAKGGSDMGSGKMGTMDNMMGASAKDAKTGTTDKMMTSGRMTKEQKIANAMSAGPMTVAGKATILDWPAKEGEKPTLLRTGSNAWTCLPDMPQTEGSDPMCLDKSWMAWVDAYLAHKPVQVSTVGIGYMTAPGGAFESNSDPYAVAKTADNQWTHHPPHVMILVPDLKALQGISTDPANGGPYVMFAGTPYAHIMTPAGGDKMMGMGMAK